MIETTSKNQIKIWVGQFTDELYKWALHKTSDSETARDLVQDTFLVAVKSFDKFNGNSSPKTWLFSILNNKIVDYYRKQYKEIIVNESKLKKEDSDSSFFDQKGNWKEASRPALWPKEEGNLLDNKDFKLQLSDCLEELPPSWNTAIKLKYISGADGNEICQEIGVSKTNYWQILHRAKLQLRKCLEINWFKLQ